MQKRDKEILDAYHNTINRGFTLKSIPSDSKSSQMNIQEDGHGNSGQNPKEVGFNIISPAGIRASPTFKNQRSSPKRQLA